MGIFVVWDCELPKTPEGFYQVQGGIDYAIAKSLAAAPFSDLLWMETKTADLEDAEKFAHAIHAQYPDKMLAYNLSPSFNWDTTGCSASSGCWSLRIVRRKRWSAAHASTAHSWLRRDAPRRPKPWARDQRSSSIWSRPRFHRGCSRSGWRRGASTARIREKFACSCAHTHPAQSCWS